MALTKAELVAIISTDVQGIVLPKIELFMDGVGKEFTKLSNEVHALNEHTSVLIHDNNVNSFAVKKNSDTIIDLQLKFNDLHGALYRDGFQKRIENIETTTLRISERFDKYIERQEEREEAGMFRRRDDKFKMIAILVSTFSAAAAVLTLITKVTGMW